MTVGRVIVAHHNPSVCGAVREGLIARGIACAVARRTEEILIMQAAMRSEVVLIDREWADSQFASLMNGLQRDVVHPYVLISAQRNHRIQDDSVRRLGANAVISEQEPERICDMIERCLARRARQGKYETSAVISRLFSDFGVPCHLRGYRYLMFMAQLLTSGEGAPENLGWLYRRAAERFGCSMSAVERGVSQAVKQCSRRADCGEISVRDFLNKVAEETCCASENPLIRPRVAVFHEEMRGVF